MLEEARGVVLPLSSVQEGLWLAQALAGNKHLNYIAKLVWINGPVDENKFLQATEIVSGEVKSLRMVLTEDDGRICQEILPRDDVSTGLKVIDVSSEPDPEAAINVRIKS